ncbi:ATP-dependent helicase [Planctomonas sp. JC2975]|uniref:UvrD-helicase domain-containing protein n=1 Tax=Planctomonas sp. JC2975 TaxID=2729626 RepID=UPI001475A957|nr:ATP-dependent helicase [Planctomonas sp. JC2975]
MTDSAAALLDGLDDAQRVAAEALLGPVCVLAGAGTGKTRAITHRIAYGVAAGVYAPNRVMALTFTTRAASELRTRLRQLGTTGVAARTFHAAALSQLNYFWPIVVGGGLPGVLDGKGRLLAQAAERIRLRIDTATLRDVAADIEWRKVSELAIDDYERMLTPGPTGAAPRTPPGSLKPQQALDLHRAYEALKDERRQLDFEDVLLACAGMIEAEPSVAMHVREQYRFFVVDEYQDVSPLQQRLLDLWLGDRSDLCVVGDASQTIYSFAGATSDFLLDFPRRYPDAAVVRLEHNYRSSAPIVETANRLMRGRPGALTLRTRDPHDDVPARSNDARTGGSASAAGVAPDPQPTVAGYETDAAEAAAVAAELSARIQQGAKPQQFALLYRVNAQAAPLEAALNAAGVAYQVRGGARFFDLPEVRQAVMTLRAASLTVTDEPLFQSVSDVLRSLGWTLEPPQAAGSVRDRWESLNAIMGLLDDVPPGTTFRQFTEDLLARQAAQHEPTIAAVTLCTLHAAKGLEWDDVHIVGLGDGLVPIGYARTPTAVDEERRLLYVGVTRARRRLALSWSANAAGPREPSRFLEELGIRTERAEHASVS